MDSKKTILVIEDEEAMLNALVESIDEKGFGSIKASNGQDGLQMALTKHPDLILVDLLMPKMDGMALIKQLRADSWGKSVPVIILTNVSPDSDTMLNAVIEHQPAYYLIKSNVQLEDIMEKVKSVLKTDLSAAPVPS